MHNVASNSMVSRGDCTCRFINFETIRYLSLIKQLFMLYIKMIVKVSNYV